MFDLNSIYEAKTINDAINALSHNPKATIIAGGTDILVGLRSGLRAGADFVSINGMEELKGIRLDDAQNIHIKPATTLREIIENKMIEQRIPYLAEAILTIGSPQIRRIATLGGNISNGFTTADAPPTLLALGAIVKISGPNGDRSLTIQDYYIKPEVMDLKTGELLTDIVIPYENYSGYAGHYIKYAVREAMDIALLGCAVVCKVSGDQRIADIRISFGAAAPIPIRAYSAEEKIKGRKIDESLFNDIGVYCKNDVSPITCKRATKEFRLHLTEVLPGRALKKALEDLGAIEQHSK